MGYSLLAANSFLFILRLGPGVLFPGFSLPLLLRFKGVSLHLHITPCCFSLYIGNDYLCIWERYSKCVTRAGAAPAVHHQITSWLLPCRGRVTTFQPGEKWLSPTRVNPLKIRAVFYSPVYHQCPAHDRCLINVCGLELGMGSGALLQVISAHCPYT